MKHYTPRVTISMLLKVIHNSKNRGMTHHEIISEVCRIKGLDYNLHEIIEVEGQPRYARVHRGVCGLTFQKIKRKYTIKVGDRYMLNSQGVQKMYEGYYA